MCINTGAWGSVEEFANVDGYRPPLGQFRTDYLRGEQMGAKDRREGREAIWGQPEADGFPEDGFLVGYVYGFLHGFGYDRVIPTEV